MMHLYFIGLSGTAMAGVAVALKKNGYQISGSDSGVYPPMSTYHEQHGIQCHIGFDATHIDPAPDLVVIGNSISRGNPEAEAVLNKKLKYVSLPQLIHDTLLAGNTSIVVAGTHGKTTTTSLIAWLLESAGRDPGYMIGGIPKNFADSCRYSSKGVFVIEGDEYDSAFFDKRSKFVHYAPDIAIINNLEFDHADIFRDLDDVKRSFRQLTSIVPGNGLLLVNGDDEHAMHVATQLHTTVQTFGLGEHNYWCAMDLQYSEGVNNFTVLQNGEVFGKFVFPFTGRFQIRNCLAAIATGVRLGLTAKDMKAALVSFLGVKRRMDVLYKNNGITIIDDFAHHPTAIRETLLALRTRYPGNRLWAIFEPRSNTTTRRIHQKELVSALSLADAAIIGAVHRPERYPPGERLNPYSVVASLREEKLLAAHMGNIDDIVKFILENKHSGDVFVVMSNGGFGGLHQKLVDTLG